MKLPLHASLILATLLPSAAFANLWGGPGGMYYGNATTPGVGIYAGNKVKIEKDYDQLDADLGETIRNVGYGNGELTVTDDDGQAISDAAALKSLKAEFKAENSGIGKGFKYEDTVGADAVIKLLTNKKSEATQTLSGSMEEEEYASLVSALKLLKKNKAVRNAALRLQVDAPEHSTYVAHMLIIWTSYGDYTQKVVMNLDFGD
jgi:hypothetical protein